MAKSTNAKQIIAAAKKTVAKKAAAPAKKAAAVKQTVDTKQDAAEREPRSEQLKMALKLLKAPAGITLVSLQEQTGWTNKPRKAHLETWAERYGLQVKELTNDRFRLV